MDLLENCLHLHPRSYLKTITSRMKKFINFLISKKCILGSDEIAAKMSELGFDINSTGLYRETCIFHAIRHSAEVVKLLVNNGSSVDIKNDSFEQPLQRALLVGSEDTVKIILNKLFADKQFQNNTEPKVTVYNSEEIVRAILRHKQVLSFVKEDYPILIFFAARGGNSDSLKLILDDCKEYMSSVEEKTQEVELEKVSPPREIDFPGKCGRTALQYAVEQELPETVRFLLKASAEVNCKMHEYYTPLHYAAYFQNEEICEILLSYGAQVNFSNVINPWHSVLSPLQLVCGRDFFDLFCLGCKNTLFSLEIIKEDSRGKQEPPFNLRIMNLLLRNTANPDIKFSDTMTPLMKACKASQLEPVKLLLAFKANIGARDYDGHTALHWAVWSNSFEIVDYLVENGANINAEKCLLVFAMHDVRHPCVEMIEYLVDVGVSVNPETNFFFTALFHNMYSPRSTDFAECLLELGADFEITFLHSVNNFHCINRKETLEILIAFLTLKKDAGSVYKRSAFEIEFEVVEIFERCVLEFEKLKTTKITGTAKRSFYDFLIQDIYSAHKTIKNKEVRKVFVLKEYRDIFPCYAYLLDKRFERLKSLEEATEEILEFFDSCGKFYLPNLVVEKILIFLSSKDFRNFRRALTGRRF